MEADLPPQLDTINVRGNHKKSYELSDDKREDEGPQKREAPVNANRESIIKSIMNRDHSTNDHTNNTKNHDTVQKDFRTKK